MDREFLNKEKTELLTQVETNLAEVVNKTEMQSVTFPILYDILVRVRGLLLPYRKTKTG